MPTELKKESSDFVITAFLDSLTAHYEDSELIKETIQGIYHSLKFTVSHFKNGQGKLIIDKIIDAANYPNIAVREIAMQCIVEIVRLCYDHISEFMADITECTMNASKKDEEEVKTQALEVWSSIAEEENMREEKNIQHFNFIDTAFDVLIEMIQETIQDINVGNEELDEEQQWGTSVAAASCLSLISLVAKDKVVVPITEFVAEKIRNENDWKMRYCGIVALGAILEGPTKKNLQSVLAPAVPMLLDLINDHHRRVKYAIYWLFSRLAKTQHELITHQNDFPLLFSRMMDGLKGDVRMAANVASIIAELADSMLNRPEKVHSCILSEVFGELCNELLAFILNDNIESETDLSRVRVSGFSALYNLLQYAPQD